MAAWDGFTEADLERIKNAGTNIVTKTQPDPPKGKQSSLGQGNRRQPSSASSRARKAASAAAGTSGDKKAPSNSGPISTIDRASPAGVSTNAKTPVVVENKPSPSALPQRDPVVMASSTSDVSSQHEKPPGDVRPCTEDELHTMKKTRLDELHEQQKKLEKINLEKKAKLQRTIAQRKLEAEKETQRLGVVQKELTHLDNIVSSDVSILRERIEAATLEFNEATRRYNAAEAEFVAAKMSLHRCSEQKDLLMEHLVTIIEQTELRKANKLAELLGTLEQADDGKSPSNPTSACTVPAATAASSPDMATMEEESDGIEKVQEDIEPKPKPPVTLLGLAQQPTDKEEEEEGDSEQS